jgi:hypothetical protein
MTAISWRSGPPDFVLGRLAETDMAAGLVKESMVSNVRVIIKKGLAFRSFAY